MDKKTMKNYSFVNFAYGKEVKKEEEESLIETEK